MPNLPDDLDAAQFVALNLCRLNAARDSEGWQASLEVGAGKFRIRAGATPSEAIAALFEPTPAWGAAPPLPY